MISNICNKISQFQQVFFFCHQKVEVCLRIVLMFQSKESMKISLKRNSMKSSLTLTYCKKLESISYYWLTSQILLFKIMEWLQNVLSLLKVSLFKKERAKLNTLGAKKHKELVKTSLNISINIELIKILSSIGY